MRPKAVLVAVILLHLLLLTAAGAAGLALAGLARSGSPSAEADHTSVQQAAVAIVIMTGGLAYTVSQIARGIRWAWLAVIVFVAVQGIAFLAQAIRIANTTPTHSALYAATVALEALALALLLRRDVRTWISAVSAARPSAPASTQIPD